jgi:hypothetical protein
MGRRAKTPAERLADTLCNGCLFYPFQRTTSGELRLMPTLDRQVGRATLEIGVEEIESGAPVEDGGLVDKIALTIRTLTAASAEPGTGPKHDRHLLGRLVRALRSRPGPWPEKLEEAIRKAETLPSSNIAPLPSGGAVIEAVDPRTGQRERFRVCSTFFGKSLDTRGVMARPVQRPREDEVFIGQVAILRVIEE